MKYPSKHAGILVAMVLAIFECRATNCHAQVERRPCDTAEDIPKFCSNRSTMSYIVQVPQARTWLHAQHPSSKSIPDQARVTISCDHDSDKPGPDDQQATMFLWHETIGTIGLAYSGRIGPKGLIFSAVPLDPTNRRSASGTTPGTFVILNMCKLQEDYINGLIFNGSQPVPLWFYGKEDKDSRTDWPSDPKVSASHSTSKGTPGSRTGMTSDTNSGADPAVSTPRELDRWKFSGIYEFEAEDEACLTRIGLMKRYDQRPPPEKLGTLPPGVAEPVNSWENRCPPRKGRLVVVAWEGGSPIYNLDHGTLVSHHVIGSQPVIGPNGTYQFQSMTPNGDTTGPNSGMFKIDGTYNSDDGSLDFYVVKPNLGRTGRLRPLEGPMGRPKIWATFERFHAEKRLDICCKVDIRPNADCDKWNKNNWDDYWSEAWKQRQKWMGMQ